MALQLKAFGSTMAMTMPSLQIFSRWWGREIYVRILVPLILFGHVFELQNCGSGIWYSNPCVLLFGELYLWSVAFSKCVEYS